MSDPLVAQRELFAILEEFFRRATGKSAPEFAKLDEFSATIKAEVQRIAPTSVEAFKWAMPELIRFYTQHRTTLWTASQSQGGVKLVLGGSSRFGRTQLDAVRRLLLYADTVLIPDPVLPWIEAERKEERFPHVSILEAVFFLLRLKPLVDSDLGFPPVIVFQSWERSLAIRDEQTAHGIEGLIATVFSEALERELSSLPDIVAFAAANPEYFLDTVEKKKLFVAPGGNVGEPLNDAIARYRWEIRQWRTGEHLETMNGLPDAVFVCNGIFERLEPQYHLLENAKELRAQPLLAIEAQAHYFSICANSVEEQLIDNEVITPTTRATIMSLASQRFEWIGNAPISALVEMRKRNENLVFREQLSQSIALLNSASLNDLDRVAAEVSLQIGALLNSHKVEARRIEETYRPKYGALAAAGLLTLGVFAIPYLAPLYAAVPPLVIASQYIESKFAEKREQRKLAGSLLGVLGYAENAPDDTE